MNELDIILKKAASIFPNDLAIGNYTFDTQEVEIQKGALLSFIRFLQDESMDYLIDITGVHYPDHKGKELAVVYHLQDMKRRIRIRVKCYLSVNEPNIPSLTEIYSSANWMERETYDFFGIIFENHPDLRRILNVDEMDYFPMRKEFPLEDQTREDKDDTMFGRQPMNKS